MRIAAAVALAVVVAPVAASAGRRGEYLDYGRVPSFTRASSIWLDVNGIPRVRYSRRNRGAYNPVTIAQYGLQEFSYFVRTADRGHLDKALLAARWLERAQEAGTGRWLYRFDWTVIGTRLKLRAPWASAMAQGQAISLLVRAYGETRDRRFLLAAARALRPLLRPASAGGLATRLKGRPFYEEYPTSPPAHVLNGFMFTLLGLRDLAHVDGARTAGILFRRGLDTLGAVLPLYDTCRGSLYHLAHRAGARRAPYVAPPRYQRLHVKLLTALAAVSGRRALRRYRDRWQRFARRTSTPRSC